MVQDKWTPQRKSGLTPETIEALALRILGGFEIKSLGSNTLD